LLLEAPMTDERKEAIRAGWREFRTSDPDAHIVMRRFGRNHEKACNRPDVLTCALLECQSANECQAARPLPESDDAR
jgi:hypothetical protein